MTRALEIKCNNLSKNYNRLKEHLSREPKDYVSHLSMLSYGANLDRSLRQLDKEIMREKIRLKGANNGKNDNEKSV